MSNKNKPDWWKKFNTKQKAKEANYGGRMELLEKLGCRLFKTDIFF